MDYIKSAYEKALERAERLGSLSREEALEMKWAPEGRRLAASFIRGEVSDLAEAVLRAEPEARPYIARGVAEVLLQNVQLPRNEAMHRDLQRALEGLRQVKRSKAQARELTERIAYIVDMFLQARAQHLGQIYAQLKARFQEELRRRAGPEAERVDVESLPEFQQELARLTAQLESQYRQALEEQKRLLMALP